MGKLNLTNTILKHVRYFFSIYSLILLSGLLFSNTTYASTISFYNPLPIDVVVKDSTHPEYRYVITPGEKLTQELPQNIASEQWQYTLSGGKYNSQAFRFALDDKHPDACLTIDGPDDYESSRSKTCPSTINQAESLGGFVSRKADGSFTQFIRGIDGTITPSNSEIKYENKTGALTYKLNDVNSVTLRCPNTLPGNSIHRCELTSTQPLGAVKWSIVGGRILKNEPTPVGLDLSQAPSALYQMPSLTNDYSEVQAYGPQSNPANPAQDVLIHQGLDIATSDYGVKSSNRQIIDVYFDKGPAVANVQATFTVSNVPLVISVPINLVNVSISESTPAKPFNIEVDLFFREKVPSEDLINETKHGDFTSYLFHEDEFFDMEFTNHFDCLDDDACVQGFITESTINFVGPKINGIEIGANRIYGGMMQFVDSARQDMDYIRPNGDTLFSLWGDLIKSSVNNIKNMSPLPSYYNHILDISKRDYKTYKDGLPSNLPLECKKLKNTFFYHNDFGSDEWVSSLLFAPNEEETVRCAFIASSYRV